MNTIKKIAVGLLVIIAGLLALWILLVMINWARTAPACYHRGGCNYGATTSALQKGELS